MLVAGLREGERTGDDVVEGAWLVDGSRVVVGYCDGALVVGCTVGLALMVGDVVTGFFVGFAVVGLCDGARVVGLCDAVGEGVSGGGCGCAVVDGDTDVVGPTGDNVAPGNGTTGPHSYSVGIGVGRVGARVGFTMVGRNV